MSRAKELSRSVQEARMQDLLSANGYQVRVDPPYQRACLESDSVSAPEDKEMNRYDDTKGDDQDWFNITEIVVPTKEDKEQLLLAFRYIHDLRDVDSDYMAVNTIMHLYSRPDLIKVR